MIPTLFLGSLLSVLIITPSEQNPELYYISSAPTTVGGYAVRVRDLNAPEGDPASAVFGRASEAFRKKDFEQVLRLLENPALAGSPDPEVLNLHGAVLTELKRYDEAVVCFRRVLEKKPDHFWARFNLAEVDFMAGRYAAARKGFQGMKSDMPAQNELLDFKTVLAWLKENNREEAQKILEGMPSPGRTAAGTSARAAFAFHGGDRAKAREYLAEAARQYPGQLEGFLGATLADFGMTKEALSGK